MEIKIRKRDDTKELTFSSIGILADCACSSSSFTASDYNFGDNRNNLSAGGTFDVNFGLT
jgi:hypothetical protein